MEEYSAKYATSPSPKPRRAAPPTQLALPCSLTEAADLAEEVARLERKLAEVHEDLADSQTSYRRLAEYYIESERRLRADIVAQKREIDVLTIHIAAMTASRSFDQAWSRRPSSPLPAWLDGALKHLLTTAHPDKWSQGQPAAPLAHELAIAVNQLRTRLAGEVA